MQRGQSLIVWAIADGRSLRARRRRVPDGQLVAAARPWWPMQPTSPSGVETRARVVSGGARAAQAGARRCGASRTASTTSCAACLPTRPPPKARSVDRRARRLRTPAAMPRSRTSTSSSPSTARSEPAEEGRVRAILHPLWDLRFAVGHQIRQMDDFARARDRQPRIPARPDRRAGGCRRRVAARADRRTRPHAGRLRSDPRRLESPDRRAARALQRHACISWSPTSRTHRARSAISGRHAPSPRSPIRRSSTAVRPIAPVSTTPRNSCCAFDRSCTWSTSATTTCSATRCRSGRRRRWDTTARARQQVERLMSDYFRHARAVSRTLAWVRQSAPVPIGANVVARRATASAFVDADRAAAHPESWLSLFQAAIDAGAPVADDALTWIHQRLDRVAAGGFLSGRRRARRAAGVSQTAQRPLRAAVGDARLRTARADVPGIPGDLPAAWCATSITSITRRRAHAADRSETSSASRRAAVKSRDRFSALRCRSRRSRSCWCSPLLFHDVGKWRDDDHVDESVRMALERCAAPPARRTSRSRSSNS